MCSPWTLRDSHRPSLWGLVASTPGVREAEEPQGSFRVMLKAAGRHEGWGTLAQGSPSVQAAGVSRTTPSWVTPAAHTFEKRRSLEDVFASWKEVYELQDENLFTVKQETETAEPAKPGPPAGGHEACPCRRARGDLNTDIPWARVTAALVPFTAARRRPFLQHTALPVACTTPPRAA